MAIFHASPYARALEQVLVESGADLDAAAEALFAFAEALSSVPGALKIFEAPKLDVEAKSALLEAIASKAGLDEVLRRFLAVVQRNFRLRHLEEIAKAFQALVDRRAGRLRASVAVASEADTLTKTAIVSALASASGAEVKAEFSIEPALLAGFRARIGSRVIDGSLSGQLERIARS